MAKNETYDQPAAIARDFLADRNLTPFLVVHPDLREDLAGGRPVARRPRLAEMQARFPHTKPTMKPESRDALLTAIGRVINIRRPSDVAGVYVAGGAGAAGDWRSVDPTCQRQGRR